MKKFYKILSLVLSLAFLSQGVSLSAKCSTPCRMDQQTMLRCVASSILHHQAMLGRQAHQGAIHHLPACGHLELSQVQAIPRAKAEFQKPALEHAFNLILAAALSLLSQPSRITHDFISPQTWPNQVHLVNPPQNAPPRA